MMGRYAYEMTQYGTANRSLTAKGSLIAPAACSEVATDQPLQLDRTRQLAGAL